MPPKASSKKNDVEALLSDLDNLGTADASSAPGTPSADRPSSKLAGSRKGANTSGAAATGDAQSLLDDLDSLVQARPAPKQTKRKVSSNLTTLAGGSSAPKSATGTPKPSSSPRPAEASTGAEATTAGTAAISASSSEFVEAPAAVADIEHPGAASVSASSSAGAGQQASWGGWGSMWSQATKLADQARLEIEKRAKEAAQTDAAKELGSKGWGIAQGVKGWAKEAGLDKLGQDLTAASRQLVNAVAPPIAAHEVIHVTLSHDMVGYDGISDVVFRVLQIVMENQIDPSVEQQLIINAAPSDPRSSSASQTSANGKEAERTLSAVEGFETAWKLSEAELSELVAKHPPAASKPSSLTNPVTTCPVFIRIQPCYAPMPGVPSGAAKSAGKDDRQLWFLLSLQDPTNELNHRTCSQAVPCAWMDIPFDQNAWVEQALVDVLEGALSILAQDYINGRQLGASRRATATQAVEGDDAAKVEA